MRNKELDLEAQKQITKTAKKVFTVIGVIALIVIGSLIYKYYR